MKNTNPGRLERWVGASEVERLSRMMRGWYGPPIALAGVPGDVYACGDGDFVGECRVGYEATALDRWRDVARALRRGYRHAARRHGVLQTGGFASFTDLLSEARGKRQTLAFYKSVGMFTNGGSSLFTLAAGTPGPGTVPAASPGGTVYTSATPGAFPFTNAASGDATFVCGSTSMATLQASCLLLYDRLFGANKTMSSTATEAVTGVPTRYQSTTSTNPDYVAGNFLFPEVSATLGATGHNWTVCTYTNQAGAAKTLPSVAGLASAATGRIDLPVNTWFAPLVAGDSGVQTLTQMQCDASVTGTLGFVIGHPLAWIITPILGILSVIDGVKSSFGLARVFDNACLALLCPNGSGGNTIIVNGTFDLVSG